MPKLTIAKVLGFSISIHILLMAFLMIIPIHNDLGKIFLYLIYLFAIFLVAVISLFRKNKILGLGLLYSVLVPVILFVIVQILVILDYRGYF